MACNCTDSILSNCSNEDLQSLGALISSLGCGPIGTNLTYMPSPSGGTMLSSTGTPAFIPIGNATNAGLLSPELYNLIIAGGGGPTHPPVTIGSGNGLSIDLVSQVLNLALASSTSTGALSSTDWNIFNNKQSALVSGTNIKTIDGYSLLGSGNVSLGIDDILAYGNFSDKSMVVRAISLQPTGTGNGATSSSGGGGNCFVANVYSGIGLAYVGQNNGVNTYTVDRLGNITANSYAIPSGTSSQFLKADGSVDTNTYALSSSIYWSLIGADIVNNNTSGNVVIRGASTTVGNALTINDLAGNMLIGFGNNKNFFVPKQTIFTFDRAGTNNVVDSPRIRFQGSNTTTQDIYADQGQIYFTQGIYVTTDTRSTTLQLRGTGNATSGYISTYNNSKAAFFNELNVDGGTVIPQITFGTLPAGRINSTVLGFNKDYYIPFHITFQADVVTASTSTGKIGTAFVQTLQARKNNDVLIANVVKPTFNDNTFTGIIHIGHGIDVIDGYGYYQVGPAALNYFEGKLIIPDGTANNHAASVGQIVAKSPNTYFVNTATGSNTTGVFEVASKPFATIDYVLGLALTDGVTIVLQSPTTHNLTTVIPLGINIIIKSDVAATLDLSSNANAVLMNNPGTTHYLCTIILPVGTLRCDKAGTAAGIQLWQPYNSYTLKVRTLYWNTTNSITLNSTTYMHIEVKNLFAGGSAFQLTNNDNATYIAPIDNFVCLGTNTILSMYGGSFIISRISGSGSLYAPGNGSVACRYYIGDITTTGISLFSGYAWVQFVDSNITTTNGVYFGDGYPYFLVITGNIKSVPKITSVTHTQTGTIFLQNFKADFGAGFLTQWGGSISIENCSLKCNAQLIQSQGSVNNAGLITIKSSTIEQVTPGPLAINYPSGESKVVTVAGLSTNATALTNQIGTGHTINNIPFLPSIFNQIVITTSANITNTTTDTSGIGQHGRTVIIDNGSSNINYTINGPITTSFMRIGTGSVFFAAGSGRTLVQIDGTALMNGAVGSTATLTSIGTTDYLRISNA